MAGSSSRWGSSHRPRTGRRPGRAALPYRGRSLGNTPFGAPFDLAAYAGRGYADRHLARRHAHPAEPAVADVLEAFHRDLRRLGIAAVVADPLGDVPMLDFAGPIDVPEPTRRAVYLDTARTALESSYFVYDLARLARVLPDHDLLCTTAPTAVARISSTSPVCRGHSGRGSANDARPLVGSTFDPFVVTMTEANRWRPKALCGHDARVMAPVWDYPGNPLELLTTMDELVDFLLANVVEGVAR